MANGLGGNVSKCWIKGGAKGSAEQERYSLWIPPTHRITPTPPLPAQTVPSLTPSVKNKSTVRPTGSGHPKAWGWEVRVSTWLHGAQDQPDRKFQVSLAPGSRITNEAGCFGRGIPTPHPGTPGSEPAAGHSRGAGEA